MTAAIYEVQTTPAVPHDVDAERCVIGSIMLDRTQITLVADWLEPSFFYDETFRACYQAIVDLYRTQPRPVPADYVTLGGVLEDREQLHLIGGYKENLTDYGMATPTSHHIVYYADRVYQKYLRRLVIESGRDVSAQGYAASDAALFENVNAIMQRVNERRSRTLLKHASEVSAAWRSQLDAGGIVSISTGLLDLDTILGGGLHPQDYVLLAARPSVGKSWLGLHIMHHITKHQGRVLYISYEMPRTDLWSRLVAIESGVSLDRVRNPRRATEAELVRMTEADAALEHRPLVFADDFGTTMETIQAQATNLQAEHGEIALIIVDYLQLINTPKQRPDANRQNDVSELSRGVKRLAGQIGCPVLALSQLNRAVESRADKVPMLSDLRESGSLEQDGDVVLFIHREEVYDANSKRKGIADIYVAKQRNGALGRVSFGFNPANGRWNNLEQYRTPEGY